jgi:hypothetical protein
MVAADRLDHTGAGLRFDTVALGETGTRFPL